jgi:glycosyltransferase involved in cell wall biosynthesis
MSTWSDSATIEPESLSANESDRLARRQPVRLAVLAASPVYYQAPLYRRIAADSRLDFTAIFASDQGARRPFAIADRHAVDWGVDALGAYNSTFLKNATRNPSGGSVFALRDIDVIACIRRGRFDVLWLHGYHTLTHVLAAATQKAVGGALLFREEQTLLSPRPFWKVALKEVGLRWLFRGSYGLFIGTENRRWFERWGMPAGRLFHVPYAVDNESLRHAASELAPHRQELRAEFGLPAHGPVILSVGRLIEKKQPLHLLRAFQCVRSERRCSLLVVGSGPLESEMRRVVTAERIPDVVFAGFLDQTEVHRAYACGDVFALVSSHDETWGVVVNEAMNFGLPIVVSDRVGSGSDLVQSDNNGFIIPHDDLEALTSALHRLIVSEDLRRQFGAASRAKVAPLTYDAAATGLAAAVRAAVGEPRWTLAEASARPKVAA